MGGVLVGRDVDARVPHSRDVERLADAVFCQQRAGQQLVGAQVGQNAAVVDEDDAVHTAPEHVLKAVLNDEDRRVGLLLDRVDQLNGLLARGRVKVCQRLIEQQNLHLIDHDAREADALLLAAGKLVRSVVEVVLDSDQLGGAAGDLVHFVLRSAAVFQRKGDVLPHRQADELAVRVLQHRADVARQLKNTAVGRVHAVHSQRACALAGVGERVQAVDAGRQRGLAAAGRPGDQHALPGVDVQIDVMQRGLLLGAMLEGKIFKGYDRGSRFSHTAPRRGNCGGTAKCLPAFVGRHTGLTADHSLSREPFLAMVLV